MPQARLKSNCKRFIEPAACRSSRKPLQGHFDFSLTLNHAVLSTTCRPASRSVYCEAMNIQICARLAAIALILASGASAQLAQKKALTLVYQIDIGITRLLWVAW